MVETIGGARRSRPFASGTAYEAYLRAEVAMARGDADGASRQLELAMMADPADGFLPARRAEMLLAAGDRDGALSVAQEATTRFPAQAATWLALGEVQTARNDRAAASGAFNRALAAAPDDPEVRAAVARAAGGSAREVAQAMSGAPGSRPGDRTVAERLALDPLRDDLPTLRSVRRERARTEMARGAYRAVDHLLAPLVEADPTDVGDRVRLIEARAADGRPQDAARLVPGVPVAPDRGGVPRAERARLWLLGARADLAAEEARAAFAADPSDVLSRAVLGEALIRTGRVAEGLSLIAPIAPETARFVEVQLAAGEGLRASGRDELSDAALSRAIARVRADDDASRDRFRLAIAEGRMRRGSMADARQVLAAIETPWGRQRRGAILLGVATPDEVSADLRVRSGNAFDDARADAWRVLLCSETPAASDCDPHGRDASLANARENAPEAPETLRALAISTSDRREGQDYLRAAASRDPLSPWNRVLWARFGHRASGTVPPPR